MEDLPARGTDQDEKAVESEDGGSKGRKKVPSEASQPPKPAVIVEDSPDPDKKAVESEDGDTKSRKKVLSEASQPPKPAVMVEDSPDPDEKVVESEDEEDMRMKNDQREASKSAVLVEDLDDGSVEDGGQKDLSEASKCSRFQTLVLGPVYKFFMSWVSMFITDVAFPHTSDTQGKLVGRYPVVFIILALVVTGACCSGLTMSVTVVFSLALILYY